jgi:UDP-N-acetylmuramoyl-tripeptide--D-alanyl-D-alanine ligase
VVVELGARGIGHVAHLCAIAEPTTGVVTTVGAAHLELFGSIDDVARGKGELVEALPPSGTAVLNADDPRVAAMAGRTAARVLRYGHDPAVADVAAASVELDAELRPRFELCSPWGRAQVALAARGRHMVANALAAACAGLVSGVPLDAVAEGLAGARLSPWRMEVVRSPGGATVVNDAYNANPVSMRAALDSLAGLPARRRIAVLGPMAELGASSAAAHAEVAERAASLGVEVIAVGCDLYGGAAVADVAAGLEELERRGLGPGDAVLVKASRVAGLERLAEELARR